MAELNNLANANAELDKKVDDLSKPENSEDLKKALTSELNGQEGEKPVDKTPEPKGDEEPKGTEAPKSNPSDQPEDKANKFSKLLKDRNEAQDTAAEAKLELQAREARIRELEAENERLKSDDGEGKDSSADEPLTKAELRKILAERENSEKQTAVAEKANITSIEALKDNKATPNADKYKDDILKIMEKHPTLNAYAAYKMLQGDGIIVVDDADPSSNSGKLNTGNRTKANLLKDKKPADMSDSELLQEINKGVKSGEITL